MLLSAVQVRSAVTSDAAFFARSPYACALRCRPFGAANGALILLIERVILPGCPCGRGENPGEVALVDALDREHHDGRGIIRVRRPDAGPNRFGERGPGLHDHDGFLGALDGALPPVD